MKEKNKMKYIDTVKNKELKKYFESFCNDYPEFIDKYIMTSTLQRLSGIGQFCGVDYSNIFHPRFWYSRLDHSIVCALITYHFTKSKSQTLAALFHDLGTPAFAHIIDFLLDDSESQESSEKNVRDILIASDEIMALLKEDNINLESIVNLKIYPILENDNPKICIDRLDGIIHTCFIWDPIWEIEEVRMIYNDIIVLTNEEGIEELGFQDMELANKFYEGAFHYSILLQSNESKFETKFLADILKKAIETKIIKFEDFYKLSEGEIIDQFIKDENVYKMWNKFTTISKIERSEEVQDKYSVAVESKKRYVVPLVRFNNTSVRLNEVSLYCQQKLEEYMNFKDSKYAYINEDL